MKRGVLSDTVQAFFGTLGALEDREARKEDREAERRWKEFYMTHLGNQEARAQESHAQQMERWGVEQEKLLREAEAREQFFQEYNLTPEAWAMMAPMEQFQLAQQNFEMAKELHTLDLETRRFDLDMKKRMAPLEEARMKYLASGAGRGGSGKEEPSELDGLRDLYSEKSTRRKTLESQIESHVKRDVTGNPDFSAVPQQLLDARDYLDMELLEIQGKISAMEQGGAGLTDFPSLAPPEPEPTGPGVSPARALGDQLVGQSKSAERAQRVEEQRVAAEERRRLRDTGMAIVGEDGRWKLSDDEAEIQAAFDKSPDNVVQPEELKDEFLGLPKAMYWDAEKNRKKPTYGPGSGRRYPGSVGVGAGGGF